MITKRIIPCLDVKDGRVVKGVNFQGLSDVSSPVELGRYYSENGADELVFYDITASAEGRALFTDILTEVARIIFIPLTVGGGINTIDDFDRVLKCGADKVSVNSGAIRRRRQSQRQLGSHKNPGPHKRGGKEVRRPVRRSFRGRKAGRRPFLRLRQRRKGKHRNGRHRVDKKGNLLRRG